MSDPNVRGRPEAAALIWSWRDPGPTAGDRRAALVRSGILRALVAGAVGSLFFYFGRVIPGSIALAISGFTLVLAVVSPTRGYLALSRAVDRAGELVGLVLTWLLLTPVFFLFFVPFGLIARRGAGDRLGRKLDRARTTYWVTRQPEKPGSLERPY